jgi:hypothetical protein
MKIETNGCVLTYKPEPDGFRLISVSGPGFVKELDAFLPISDEQASHVFAGIGGRATAGITSKLKAKTSAANGRLGGRPVGSGKKK